MDEIGRCHYYDRDGMPISLTRWADLMEDMAYRRVAQDDIDLYRISTVWLGLDHSLGFFGEGGPHIFETMVFLAGTPNDTYMHRYSTLAEANAGHEAVCAEIRALMMDSSEDADRDSEDRQQSGDGPLPPGGTG